MDFSRSIIHVGYPKTGTSFLQNVAFPEAHNLGVLNFVHPKSMSSVRNYLTNCDGFSYREDRVWELLEGHLIDGINLLSCESFSGAAFYKSVNNLEVMRRLGRTFPGAKILISVRNQVDLLYSLYKQYIHEGGCLSLKKFLPIKDGKFVHSHVLDDHSFNLDALKFPLLIEGYRRQFGGDRVRVVAFEDFVADKESFVAGLLEWFDTPLDKLQFSYNKVNQGYGAAQILLARIFSPFVRSHFNRYGLFPVNRRLRFALQSKFSRNVFGSSLRKSPEICSLIRQYYRESNQVLLSNYLPDPNGNLSRHYLD